jgi:hypothetical protein
MRLKLLILLFALAALFGCSTETVNVPATQLVVRVSASAGLQMSLARLRLRTAGPSDGDWQVRRETSFEAGDLKWPVELVLVPRSEAAADETFEVIVDALDDSGQMLVQARALVSFELRKAHTLELVLEACGATGLCSEAEHCVGPDCETCSAGQCETTPTYDPKELPPFPSEVTRNQDGGVSADAAQSDAAEGAEAGMLDAQMDAQSLLDGSASADADAAPELDSALGMDVGACQTGCEEGGSGEAGSDASTPADAGSDVGSGSDAGPVCTSANNSCTGTDLSVCNAQGSGFVMTSCPVDCALTPTPHCTRLYPSAPVVDTDLAPAGLLDITVPSGVTLMNTDTGAISGGVTRAANTIASKREVVGGIAFHQSADGQGVFSFAKLSIASGATLKLVGESNAVLVAADSLIVLGVIDARPMDASGTLCPAARVAGPGADRGGLTGSVACCPMYTNGAPGDGPGGASGGVRPMQGNASGGGGAGHAAAGGQGGGSCHQNVKSFSGGNGGPAYNAISEGGSGGGGGGLADGGGGGGAVRLVAGLVITIGDGVAVAGINAGGCGGKGSTGSGSGGGGSGGSIVLEAPFVQVLAKGTLAANGGSGGAYISSTASDGQPGQLGAAPALAPGNTPSSAGEGNGGAGDAPAGRAIINTVCGTLEGGGGGGAAGVVRVRSATPGISNQAVLSPSVTSGAAQVVSADVH